MLKAPLCILKTALRESFYSIHVGLRDLYKVKIETDQGKIGVGEMVPVSIFPCILGANQPTKYFKNRCFIILAMYGAGHFSFLSHAKKTLND